MSFTIQKDVSLADLTTLKIGGKARFFVRAKKETEIVEALAYASKNNLQVFILGGGSNVLISDAGFDGLILQIALKGISTSPKKTGIVDVMANAGEDWDSFVKFCVEKNLQGLECLSGIPGFVGGTPVQNVGAYGQEVSETVREVRAFDRIEKQFVNLTAAECRFAYRSSIFNTTKKNRFIVSAVTYALKSGEQPKIEYRDLQNYFIGKTPNLDDVRRAVLEIRAGKSMVINALDPNSKSAGSFFKNPVITEKKFSELEKCAKKLGLKIIPHFYTDEENVKIPAAWLIENSGFRKGFAKGNAGISTNHTLAIVNLGNASAAEVLALKNEIQTAVKNIFGIDLIPEPVFVGFKRLLTD